MHNVQANAPLLEGDNEESDSVSSSAHAEDHSENVDSHEPRAEDEPRQPGTVYSMIRIQMFYSRSHPVTTS
jgi:hypothetical protein